MKKIIIIVTIALFELSIMSCAQNIKDTVSFHFQRLSSRDEIIKYIDGLPENKHEHVTGITIMGFTDFDILKFSKQINSKGWTPLISLKGYWIYKKITNNFDTSLNQQYIPGWSNGVYSGESFTPGQGITPWEYSWRTGNSFEFKNVDNLHLKKIDSNNIIVYTILSSKNKVHKYPLNKDVNYIARNLYYSKHQNCGGMTPVRESHTSGQVGGSDYIMLTCQPGPMKKLNITQIDSITFSIKFIAICERYHPIGIRIFSYYSGQLLPEIKGTEYNGMISDMEIYHGETEMIVKYKHGDFTSENNWEILSCLETKKHENVLPAKSAKVIFPR